LPLNPEKFTTLGDCETYSALLLKCTYFAHRCAFVPISRRVESDLVPWPWILGKRPVVAVWTQV
jgi:hypothetical protein